MILDIDVQLPPANLTTKRVPSFQTSLLNLVYFPPECVFLLFRRSAETTFWWRATCRRCWKHAASPNAVRDPTGSAVPLAPIHRPSQVVSLTTTKKTAIETDNCGNLIIASFPPGRSLDFKLCPPSPHEPLVVEPACLILSVQRSPMQWKKATQRSAAKKKGIISIKRTSSSVRFRTAVFPGTIIRFVLTRRLQKCVAFL